MSRTKYILFSSEILLGTVSVKYMVDRLAQFSHTSINVASFSLDMSS